MVLLRCGVRYYVYMKRFLLFFITILIIFGGLAWLYSATTRTGDEAFFDITIGTNDQEESPADIASRTVQLFYYNPAQDTDVTGNVMCSRDGLVAVSRPLASRTPIKDTITLLLRGELTDVERMAGITTEFPLEGVTLLSVALSDDGILRVALSDPYNRLTGGSCRTAILAGQIVATVEQFSEVREVVFVPDTLFQP